MAVQLQCNPVQQPVQQPVNTSHVNSTPYQHVLDSFRDVFRLQLKQQRGTAPKHGVYHHITTSGPPVFSRPRRLSPLKLQHAKTAFWEIEAMGVCTKASSPWAAPLHMTQKTDGTWSKCGDYRRLNNVTEADKYPMPNIQDIMNALGKAAVFSRLDLLKGYFQVPVTPSDVPKTAFTTPFGSFVFHYPTFCLKNSGATFQRMMDNSLGHLSFVVVYIADILIFLRKRT